MAAHLIRLSSFSRAFSLLSLICDGSACLLATNSLRGKSGRLGRAKRMEENALERKGFVAKWPANTQTFGSCFVDPGAFVECVFLFLNGCFSSNSFRRLRSNRRNEVSHRIASHQNGTLTGVLFVDFFVDCQSKPKPKIGEHDAPYHGSVQVKLETSTRPYRQRSKSNPPCI